MGSVNNAKNGRRQQWWSRTTPLNNAQLNQAFKKRSKTLVRKASQLQTLCDVRVCLVCVGSSGQVETWPQDQNQVTGAILDFYNQQPHSLKKDETILDLLRKKKRKLEEKKLKEQKDKLGASIDVESQWIDGLASRAEAPALMVLLQTLRYCLTMVEQEMEKKEREEIGVVAAAAASLEGEEEVVGDQDWSVGEIGAMLDGVEETEDNGVDQLTAEEIRDLIQQLLEPEDPTIFSL